MLGRQDWVALKTDNVGGRPAKGRLDRKYGNKRAKPWCREVGDKPKLHENI
jgi:hypothetical protein